MAYEAELEELRQFAASRQIAALGMADLESLWEQGYEPPNPVPRHFTRAVVLGVRLHDAVIDLIEDRPIPLYFHHYRQANYLLDRVAFEVGSWLQSRGASALAIPASQVIVRQPMRGHLSHKFLGWAAGLGWIGRSSLLVSPEAGARMRYVSILTDLPLPAGSPMDRDCGDCTACIRACPAGAIGEQTDGFDLDACYEKLTEFSRLPFVSQHICGVCLKACRPKGGDRL